MLSLNEIGIIPAKISQIRSRSEVNPYVEGDKLPIFVSPMTCIINEDNFEEFKNSKFIPICPIRANRDVNRLFLNDGNWYAVTMKEFREYFVEMVMPITDSYKILIDVADGHMQELYNMVRQAKAIYPDLTVMVGNIANPETYIDCCKARVDYVRVGIGGGKGCLTSVLTGIHASLAWLLTSINEIKSCMTEYETYGSINYARPSLYEGINGFRTKVIADGGIDTIDKIIKCLALGADYVMLGKMIAECDINGGDIIYYADGRKARIYYGQASRYGQIDRFGEIKSEPEGTEVKVEVNTTLEELANKISAIMRSAMSYCNAKNLDEFIGKPRYECMSYAEFNEYKK